MKSKQREEANSENPMLNNDLESPNNETSDVIKEEADIYFDIAETLMNNNGMFSVENINSRHDATKALVTSAIYGYSAELYFKFIISQFNEEPTFGHNIYKIYTKINNKECSEFLEKTFSEYFLENDEFYKKGLSGILQEIENNFIDHKYIAEKINNKKWFNIRLHYNYLFCGYLNELTDKWIKVKYSN